LVAAHGGPGSRRHGMHVPHDQRRNAASLLFGLPALGFRSAERDLRSALPIREGEAQYSRRHRGAHLQAAAAQRQTARQPEEAWQLGGIAAAGRWRNENKHSSDCPTRFTSEADRKTREDTMREIGHFVGGKEVKGTSGRFGDVFNPNTGEVQAHVAFASKSE